MNELRPCKCGSTKLDIESWNPPRRDAGLERYVLCLACGESGPSSKTEQQAIDRWNQQIQ